MSKILERLIHREVEHVAQARLFFPNELKWRTQKLKARIFWLDYEYKSDAR